MQIVSREFIILSAFFPIYHIQHLLLTPANGLLHTAGTSISLHTFTVFM
jgi:hypothetical protein